MKLEQEQLKELTISYKYIESEDAKLKLNRAFDILFKEIIGKENVDKYQLTSIDT